MQHLSDKQDPVNTAIILDIDVYEEVSLGPEDPKIYEILSILRKTKNEIFFSSITDKAKGFFR